MSEVAKLEFRDSGVIELPIVDSTEGTSGLDISGLMASVGLTTFDQGFINTSSSKSAITFIDGDNGVLRYRGYPIEELASSKSFLDVAYLPIHGELPNESEAEIGTPVARIPVGGELEIEVRLESVHEGILATGEVFATGIAECSRCLDEIKLEIEVDFQELFTYSSSSDDELVVDGDGEHIDIEQVVIDSVVLNLPFQPICSESCSGLCPECGLKLSENPGHEDEKPVDSRFEALKDLYSKEE